MNKRKIELCVEGMHCKACELLIEDKLSKVPGVKNVDAKLSSNALNFTYSGKKTDSELIKDLNERLIESDYSIYQKDTDLNKKKNKLDYIYGLLFATLIILLYKLIESSGILSLNNGVNSYFLTAFLVGVIASLSTCSAIVGGLVLSITSEGIKTKKLHLSLLSFHISRIITFALGGLILGLIGKWLITDVNLNLYNFTIFMKILLFITLLLLGLNHLELIRFSLSAPKSIFKSLSKVNSQNFYPSLAGFSTFFIPCGFTLGIQIQALSLLNPLDSMLILLGFVLGTMPVLILISFLSVKLSYSLKSSILFKTTGFLLIAMALSELIVLYNLFSLKS